MSAHSVIENCFLVLVVLVCWLGAIGMWRMRTPVQALHYLSLPATLGAFALTIAVFLADGANQAFWKTLLIACILFAFNSVVAHATARSFRARELGHWEPLDGDPFELVRDTEKK
jgi:monovalent cation/proton antiporter MnhG/PhaG subunit